MKTRLFEKKANRVHSWHAVEKFSPALSDEAFWGDNPRYYSTIKPVSFKNDLYLTARGKKGLITWKYEKNLNKWIVLDEFFPAFSDDTNWSKPEYYTTIKTIAYNDELYLMARGEKGMLTFIFNKKENKWNRKPIDEFFPVFANEKNWNKPEYYLTLKPFVFKDSLFLVARGKEGLNTFMFNRKLNKWNPEPLDRFFPVFKDINNWDKPEYYSTIKPIVFKDHLFLMARDKKGMITYKFDFEKNNWMRKPIEDIYPSFSDELGWNKVEYYSTIKPIVFNNNLFLIGRDRRGLVTFKFDEKNNRWDRKIVDEFFPVFSDEMGWNKPEYFSTIKPTVAYDRLFLVARDKEGVVTWLFDMNTNKWRREPVDAAFPPLTDDKEWNRPEYYSTIMPGVVNNKFVLMARDKKGMLTWKFNMPSN